MSYEITLLEADIRNPMDGNMLLGLNHEGKQEARLEYSWNTEKFIAIFHVHAPSLPTPAHPTVLLQKPIEALYAVKTDAHPLIIEVFKDHQITIEITK